MIGIAKSLFKSNVKVVSGGGGGTDPDALAYFTANTAITSAADKNAINTFYLGLKSDGIYTKIKAMYLPIWGSASSSKWNLVNPLDTDAAFRLTFSSGWAYSNSGITPTNAYVNTFFVPSTQLNVDSASYGIYGQTDVGNDGYQHGVFHSGVGYSIMIPKNTAGNLQNFLNSTTSTNITGGSSKAFYQMSRTSNTNTYHSRNSTVTTVSLTRTGNPGYNFYWGARSNAGTPEAYSPLKFSFMYMGTGLTDTEMSNFYTRVNTLMTYFGINV